jgi:hypothetical protein
MKLLKNLPFFILLLLMQVTSFSQQITFNKVISPLGGFRGIVEGFAQEANKEELGVNTQEGEGTAFTIQLPGYN